jgi:hypothetical protein
MMSRPYLRIRIQVGFGRDKEEAATAATFTIAPSPEHMS